MKKPKILILDDSTSAVDTFTDSKIREAFASAIPDTTKIIIAQRISSVESADKIIVLDDGKINDIGTHDELFARNEIYREVWRKTYTFKNIWFRIKNSSNKTLTEKFILLGANIGFKYLGIQGD